MDQTMSGDTGNNGNNDDKDDDNDDNDDEKDGNNDDNKNDENDNENNNNNPTEINFYDLSTNVEEWNEKANRLLQLAEKKTARKRKGFIANAPGLRWEEATAIYAQTAEAFRICQRWQDSAKAYAKAGAIQVQLDRIQEAAVYYCQAADAMKKASPEEAHHLYCKSISLYCDVEKYNTAGRIQRKLAEWNEHEKNYDVAIDQYQRASHFFMAGNNDAQSNACLLQSAYLMGIIDRFAEAAEIYSNIGKRMLDDNRTKFNAKRYFLRSGLLLLAAGESHSDELQRYLDEFKSVEPHFLFSRECTFLANLMLIVKDKNIHDFADHVYFFDEACCLDAWCLNLLKRVKEFIEEEDDDDDREDGGK